MDTITKIAKDIMSDKQKEIDDLLIADLPEGHISSIKEYCKYCGKEKIFNWDKYDRYSNRGLTNISIWVYDEVCECLKIEREKDEQELLRISNLVYNRYRLKTNYKKSGFSRKLRGFRLNRLDCEHIEIGKEYVKNFKPYKSKGLFCLGSTGNGKTTFATCIGKELLSKGKSIIIKTFGDYLNAMQKAEFNNEGKDKEWLLSQWAEKDLVIIDDFGREKYTDNRLVNTVMFFDALVNNCTSFIITANPESIARIRELPEFAAIFDRIAGDCQKLVFKGNSFRRA